MSRLSTGLAREAAQLADYVVSLASGTTALDPAKHANRLLQFTAAADAYTVNLPYATGSGDVYEFLNTIVKTSGSIIINATHPGTASNKFVGTVVNYSASTVSTVTFSSTANDIITLNITTTGAAKAGDYLKLQDVAPTVWRVVDFRVFSSGNPATPFSG